MTEQIEYLINLHKEGKIDDSALNKALNALKESSVQDDTTLIICVWVVVKKETQKTDVKLKCN